MTVPDKNQRLRWSLLVRLRLIEIISFWEGRITTTHLMNSFGIARLQASKDINYYIDNFAPDNLLYDTSLRGYRPTKKFEPKFTKGEADEYLQILTSYQSKSKNPLINIELANTELLQAPLRHVGPEILRAITQAIRNKQKIDIGYVSLFSPDEESRIIAPHTLVCTPLRWHVRAYCEKNRDFKDFVLSRFREVHSIEGHALYRKEHDALWNKSMELEIIPDPRLSTYQQKIIAHDYNMQDGTSLIHIRAALIPYLLQMLNIDLKPSNKTPEAQQIIIKNACQIRDYLFGSKPQITNKN